MVGRRTDVGPHRLPAQLGRISRQLRASQGLDGGPHPIDDRAEGVGRLLLGLRYGVGMLMNVSAGLSMIYGLVDSLLIFRESRKCLHDSIADTRVIKL